MTYKYVDYSYGRDLAERVATTFGFAFLSVFSVSDLSTFKSAAVAGAAAALSLVKGLLAKKVGDDSAGLK